MTRKRVFFVPAMLFLFIGAIISVGKSLTDKEQLGKELFFDKNLSSPAGQSCADCHAPAAGFNGNGQAQILVYEGAVKGRFGNRNAPAAAYASYSPVFECDTKGDYQGGQFWDGRAATLVEQAQGPFLNPLEQNLADKAAAVEVVRQSRYAELFRKIFGKNALEETERAYAQIAEAIAAYESSSEVNRFSSKYDRYLKGKASLSPLEKLGLELFEGKARCSSCHPSRPSPDGVPPLLTDFSYDNIGVPRNPNNPFYRMPATHNPDGEKFIDYGLGGCLKEKGVAGFEKQLGKFKVPTLRNIALAPPYSHNGYFKTLEEIVRFYNSRDVGTWPKPEVEANLNREELGNLKLTPQEEKAIVAFLKILNDGF